MNIIEAKPEWSVVPQIEVGDRVRGGKDGPANKQAQALANRTEIIKSAVLCYPDYATAEAAAAELPEGQVIEAPNADGRLSRFNVQGGALVYKSLAADAESTSFNPAGAGAISRTVQDKMREWVSVKDFGAMGDGITDDTAAIQAALDFAISFFPRSYSVFVPKGDYRITSITVPSTAVLRGDYGMNWGTRFRHIDNTKSAIIVNPRGRVMDISIQCENTNRVSPVAAPPTILMRGSYPEVHNIRFQDAYIAIATDDTSGAAVVIDRIYGFVHHRMVLLKDTRDYSYISNLHSQNPDGVPWDTSWHSYSNKILVELDDADGAYGNNWFSFAGFSLIKRSSGGNLGTYISNFGVEESLYGVYIDTNLTTNEHPMVFSNGYFQTNNRTDGIGLIYINADNGDYIFDNVLLDQSAGRSNSDVVKYVRVEGGACVIVNNCVILARSYSYVFSKDIESTLSISGCTIRDNFLKLFDFDAGSKNLYFDESNRVTATDAARYGNDPKTLINSNVVYGSGFGTLSGKSSTREVYIPSQTLTLYTKSAIKHECTDYGWPRIDQGGKNSDGVVTGYSSIVAQTMNGTAGSFEQRYVFTPYRQSSAALPVSFDASGNIFSSHVLPREDNSYAIGSSVNRFANIYAANGAIQTSDARLKTEHGSVLGLEFISALRPVSYKWDEGGKEPIRQVYRNLGGEELSPEDEGAHPAELITKSVPGNRTHWGLIAQEVKAAIDAAGVDFGGWVLTDKDDPQSVQALRYDQFIAPLIKAVQELSEKNSGLEQRIVALENQLSS